MENEKMNMSTPVTTVEVAILSDLPALIAMTVYMGLLSVVGLVGNVLVIVSVALTPRLRSAPYVFIVNLSIADLVVNVVVIPLIGISFFNYGWPYETSWCCVVANMFYLSLGSSLITLTMVAANRYSLVSCSKRSYRRYCGWQGTTFALLVNWLGGILLIVLAKVTGISTVRYSPNARFCYLDSSVPKTYWYTTGVLIYFTLMCFLLIPILYIKTFHTLHASRRRAHSWARQTTRRNNNSIKPRIRHAVHPAEIKLSKLMAMIFTVIIICWTPVWITNFFKLNYDIPKAVERVAIMLVLTNSSINPYLYAWLNKNFLQAYKRILRCGQNTRVHNLEFIV